MSLAVEAPPKSSSISVIMPNGDLRLEYIGTSNGYRGRGSAEVELSAICFDADRDGRAIRLEASPLFGSDVSRLYRWYSRHGFVIDHSAESDSSCIPMVRFPRPVAV